MDRFEIIQDFFSRMQCHFCEHHLEPEGVELIRHDEDVYIVNVHCIHCARQMGVAMVGLEGADIGLDAEHYEDPELTDRELEQMASLAPIGYDDVLDAHAFFNSLGPDWFRQLAEKRPIPEITPEPESEAS